VLDGIERVALYEPPFIVDDSRTPIPAGLEANVRAALAGDRRGEAVRLFMRDAVQMPRLMVAAMRFMPVWKKLKAVAHTLPYDFAIVGDNQQGVPYDASRWSSVTVPTLVADGGKSPDWMRNAARELAAVLPNARYETLAGQTHMVKPAVLAPVLTEFFASPAQTPVAAA